MPKKTYELETELTISGESEYKDACKEISKNISLINSEMRLMTAQFADNEHSTQALTAKQDLLKRKLKEQSDQVEVTKAMLKKLKEEGQEGSETWKEYEIKLNNAKTAMIETENKIGSVTKELKDHKIGWDDIGKAVGETAKGFGVALAALGTFAVGAASALAGLTVSAADYADDLLMQAENTRQSTDELQKYEYACRFVDADVNTLTKSMAKNIKSMDAAREGTGDTADAYKAIGVSVTNANGQLRDSNDVFWESIDALGKIENETERDALSMQLFGKSAQDLNTIINAGSEKFKSYGEEAEAIGAVMSEDQLDRLGKFKDKLDMLGAATDGLKRSAGLVALPFLDIMATKGIPILTKFSKGINDSNGDIGKIGGVIGEALSGIVGLITESLPQFIDMGVLILQTFIQGIVDNAPMLANAAVQIITSLVTGLLPMLPLLVDGALQIVTALANGIGTSLPVLIPTIVSVIMQIIQTIIDNLPALLTAALAIVTGLTQGIINAIPVLIEALPAIITSIVEFLVQAIPAIIEAGIQLLTALVTALPEIIDAIITALPQIIDAIVNGLSTSIPAIIEAGIQLFIALITALPEIITTVISAIPQIISSIVTAIWDNRSQIIDAGKNLIEGLWDGIVAMGDWLWEKVNGFFSDVVGWAKKALGISSPSKVFAGIGENMALGLGEGFGGEITAIGREIQRKTGELIPSIHTNVQIGKDAQKTSAAGMMIQIDQVSLIVNGTGKDGAAIGKAAGLSFVQYLKGVGQPA